MPGAASPYEAYQPIRAVIRYHRIRYCCTNVRCTPGRKCWAVSKANMLPRAASKPSLQCNVAKHAHCMVGRLSCASLGRREVKGAPHFETSHLSSPTHIPITTYSTYTVCNTFNQLACACEHLSSRQAQRRRQAPAACLFSILAGPTFNLPAMQKASQ